MIRNPIQALAKFLVTAELPEDLIEKFVAENPEPTQDQLQELINQHEIEDPEEIEEAMYELDKKGVDNLENPRAFESNWQAIARRELAAKLGMLLEDLEEMSHPDDDVLQLEGKGDNKFNGESEWDVYENSDEAEEAAVDRLKEQIDEGEHGISDELMMEYTEIPPSYIRSYANDEANAIFEGVDTEELVDQAEAAGIDVGDEDYEDEGEGQDEPDIDYEEIRAKLISKKVEEIASALENDALGWFKEMYGDGEEAIEQLKSMGTIDTEGLAKYIVDQDGVGQTLDFYDGEEIELPSGAIAIGTN